MIAALLAAAVAAPSPATVVTIDPAHRLVEGVASDGRTIWASSVLDRQIIECRKSCRTLATMPAGLHPFAIAWDQRLQRLWVAADCPPGVPGIASCARGALIGLDRRGRTRTRIAPTLGTFHPGDVSASPRGVFVSDSQNGMVFRLAATGRSLGAVVLPDVGKSAQGSALDQSGKQLVVADYAKGIARVDLANGAHAFLPRQDGKPLRGIDGLVRCGATYIGVYNGAAPGRLMAFTISATAIEVGELVPGLSLPDPTQIAFDGKRLLVVANSGWDALGKGATTRAAGAPIIAIPLAGDCTAK